jgi:hypothetical protein
MSRLKGAGNRMSEWNKIFFMHIPKTAGSAFNHIFKPCMPPERYFEHMESRKAEIDSVVSDGQPFFLSGHLTFDLMRHVIDRQDVFSVTILRNPVDQLLSHLNWVKYVGSPQFPNPKVIPDAIMALAKQLYEVPLADVDKVGELLEIPIGYRLFDNMQVRYLASKPAQKVEKEHLEQALENFRNLNFVFSLSDIEQALPFLRKYIPGIDDIQHFNEARINDTFDIQLRSVRDFVNRWTQYDRVLHDAARRHSFSQYLIGA